LLSGQILFAAFIFFGGFYGVIYAFKHP
jgi:hypothetical protein